MGMENYHGPIKSKAAPMESRYGMALPKQSDRWSHKFKVVKKIQDGHEKSDFTMWWLWKIRKMGLENYHGQIKSRAVPMGLRYGMVLPK